MYKISKNKKGFTFAELSAVISIIAIIATIAIPLTIRAVGNARVKMMKNQEELLSLVGKDYFLDNREMLPEHIGTTSTVTLATLVEEGYTKEVKDYNKELCDLDKSYIEAYKVKKGEYQYYTYLECNSYATGNAKIGQE
jgi:prepilin-type N-terminal cleavage/methylation domain-containing protein